MPVRDEFFHLAPRETFADSPFTVLITGGSRGSRTLNESARDSWPLFAMASRRIRLIHQTGVEAHEALLPEFDEKGIDGELLPFIDNMPAAFARADLIICRSGASTVAEIAAAGKAALLVPFPYAADDHQFRNAEAMANAGAARLVLDKEMNGRRLFDEVMRLAGELDLLQSMGEKAREFGKPGAAERAAAVLEELAVR
jgi:UDP-N-acetylglucosamine--N-acetylmuramyl-(pentapeptide) pyrophosphoryl-undecaprenol N-acetylglucosamine transferase